MLQCWWGIVNNDSFGSVGDALVCTMCTYLSQFAGFFAFLARFGLIGVGGFGKDHAGCHSSETGSALLGLGRGSVKNEAELLLFIQHLYAWPRPLQTILGLTKAPLGRTPPSCLPFIWIYYSHLFKTGNWLCHSYAKKKRKKNHTKKNIN